MGASCDFLTETVPVWLVSWGTCMTLIPARTREHAVAIARARDEWKVPGRVPQSFAARKATEVDVERFKAAGMLVA